MHRAARPGFPDHRLPGTESIRRQRQQNQTDLFRKRCSTNGAAKPQRNRRPRVPRIRGRVPARRSRRTVVPPRGSKPIVISNSTSKPERPLVVEDLYGIYTGYPFEVRLFPNRTILHWRKSGKRAGAPPDSAPTRPISTAPHYEQLQYAGDTRIQALISLYVSGDDRSWCARRSGCTTFRARTRESPAAVTPSHIPQYIPPFSLYWIGMIHDYWMHRSDDAFVRSFLPGFRTVLSWFTEKIDPHTGLLKNGLPHWNFTDWATSWERGYRARKRLVRFGDHHAATGRRAGRRSRPDAPLRPAR